MALRLFMRDKLPEVATFEDIKAGAQLRGLDADGVAQIVQVTRFGPDALNLVFRVSGRVGGRLAAPEALASSEACPSACTDADGERISTTALRRVLAALRG